MAARLLLAAVLLALFILAHATDGDKVLFSTVTTLQFSATSFATSRRGRRHAQLRCVTGSASGFWWHPDWYPRVASCVRYGTGADWTCSAKLRKFLELGSTKVLCERYDDDDRYILAGSCRLHYALNFTTFQARFVHVLYGAALATALFFVYALVRYRSMTTFKNL